MIAPTIRATRTNTDFQRHVFHTTQTDADADWVFIVDRVNIHCCEEIVRYVADPEEIDQLKIAATSLMFSFDSSKQLERLSRQQVGDDIVQGLEVPVVASPSGHGVH